MRSTETSPHSSQPLNFYTSVEEVANGITHGVGAALSLAGLVVLVVLAALYGDAWRVVSFSIYGSTLFVLYLASTLYHSFPQPRVKRIFRIIDHASIYLLIAGTCTPFLLVSLRGTWGWTLLGFIWALALSGIVFNTLYARRFPKLSTFTYIFMGCLCLVVLPQLWNMVPLQGLFWLAAGGVVYLVGVIFYAWDRIPYNHAVWHLFVLGGSTCHYFVILFYLLPRS